MKRRPYWKSCNCYCVSSVTSHVAILKQKNMQLNDIKTNIITKFKRFISSFGFSPSALLATDVDMAAFRAVIQV